MANLRSSRAFTLFEVMVALAILATTLTALMSSFIASARQNRENEILTTVTMLARQKMNEAILQIEDDLGRGVFPDEKKDDGTFDEPYKDFRWAIEIKKVELPSMQGQGGDEGANPLAGGAMDIISKEIDKMVREMKLTISWGEDDNVQSVVVVTHVANMKS